MSSEVFLESWDLDVAEARQLRDQRLMELTEQGYECQALDLWNAVSGRRVFEVHFEVPEDPQPQMRRRERRATEAPAESPQRKLPVRRKPS